MCNIGSDNADFLNNGVCTAPTSCSITTIP
jgi:hypothetical protein